MSRKSKMIYKKIEEKMAKCVFMGERSEDLVELAEEALEIKFSNQHREFVKKLGAGSIGSQEIYGVTTSEFVSASVPNSIWLTLIERKEIALPKHLVVIQDIGDGEFLCLDYSKLNKDGEPPVVSFYPGFDLKIQTYEVIANDFLSFLELILLEEFGI